MTATPPQNPQPIPVLATLAALVFVVADTAISVFCPGGVVDNP
jgi:hypothetical protein